VFDLVALDVNQMNSLSNVKPCASSCQVFMMFCFSSRVEVVYNCRNRSRSRSSA
jgi:hypothetical protein